MSWPTSTIRWAAAKHYLDLMRDDVRLDGVQLEPGFPGSDNLLSDSVWIDGLDGTITYPFSEAGRKTRDDRFDVPFEIRVVGRKDLDDTMQRVEGIVAVICDVSANDPSLEGFEGIMQSMESHVRSTCAWLPDGPIGFAEVTASMWARYL